MGDFKNVFKNDESSEALKCGSCAKYLSVAPIFHSPSGYLCGRCEVVTEAASDKNVVFERQILYENISKNIVFPCSYEIIGCRAELKWDEVVKHEKTCPFRNTICPFSKLNETFLSLEQTCEWRGNSQQLVSHVVSAHRDSFVNPPQICLRTKFQTTFFFTEVLQQVIMIICKYHKHLDKFSFYVLANLTEIECNFFRFQLEVSDEEKTTCVVLRRNKIEPLCDHIFKGVDIEGGLEMDVKTMSEMLKNTKSFFVKVSITKKNRKELKVLKSNLPPDSVLNINTREWNRNIDEGILQELECPVCNDYMVPPIFICQSGHSVCDNCNKQVSTCPTCRSTMLNTRNFTLEKLTGLVSYPCKNRTTGCFFVASSDKIREHERTCFLTGKNCVLSCSWKGNTMDMIIHLTDKHVVLERDTVVTVALGAQRRTKNEAVIYDNQVFLFTFTSGFKTPFYYNLQHLGSDDKKYKFEVQVIDKSGNELNLVLRHLCSRFMSNSDKKDLKKDEPKQGFSLPYNLIQPLVFESKEFYYKINIFKVTTK